MSRPPVVDTLESESSLDFANALGRSGSTGSLPQGAGTGTQRYSCASQGSQGTDVSPDAVSKALQPERDFQAGSGNVRLCWQDRQDLHMAVSLQKTTWRRTFTASTAGAAYIFCGLVVLGLGERGSAGASSGSKITLRVIAWWFIHVMPFSIAASNTVGTCLVGILPRSGVLHQLLLPSLTPWRLMACARQSGCTRKQVVKAGLIPILFNGVPMVVAVILLAVPVGGDEEHLGFILVTLVGGLLARAAVGKNLVKLYPPPDGGVEYFKGAMKNNGHTVIGFFMLCTLFAVLQPRTGPWLSFLMGPVIGIYELSGVLMAESSFTNSFIMNSTAMRSYAGIDQGVIPSIFVCIAHCNAETARLALLVSCMESEDAHLRLALTILGTLISNILIRTKWQLRLLRFASCGRLSNSNMLTLLLRVRFQMGYPRFFTLAAVALARLALGSSPSPGPMISLAAALLLVSEVAEDFIVSACNRCGFHCELPFAPLPQESEIQRRAARRHLRSTSGGAAQGKVGGCLCRKKVVPELGLSNIVPASACEEILMGHNFSYSPVDSASLPNMPLWAHFSAVYASQMHLVLCLVFFGNGVPWVLGLCDEPGYSGAGRGLLWWPLLEDDAFCLGI